MAGSTSVDPPRVRLGPCDLGWTVSSIRAVANSGFLDDNPQIWLCPRRGAADTLTGRSTDPPEMAPGLARRAVPRPAESGHLVGTGLTETLQSG